VRYPILEGTAKDVGRDSSVGIVTHYGLDDSGSDLSGGGGIFGTYPDQPWGSPSLPYNVYWVSFPWVKQLGSGTEPPPPPPNLVLRLRNE